MSEKVQANRGGGGRTGRGTGERNWEIVHVIPTSLRSDVSRVPFLA